METRKVSVAKIAMLLFVLCLFDVCLGRQWQREQYENGRQVVACSRKGRFSGVYYLEYVCARGNDVWQPVATND